MQTEKFVRKYMDQEQLNKMVDQAMAGAAKKHMKKSYEYLLNLEEESSKPIDHKPENANQMVDGSGNIVTYGLD